ncbi:hypothetical protein SAMN05421809_2070 [Natronorubrum daqingense]|uniref:Uncharacterized protein n=1 Tax=Natronorubrum daqingense TaxID=588898 RepID=A0A1N7D566_9EURY|nr:hypothetical protein SAMN05421809_2070 [Natronorubrum daqingense]
MNPGSHSPRSEASRTVFLRFKSELAHSPSGEQFRESGICDETRIIVFERFALPSAFSRPPKGESLLELETEATGNADELVSARLEWSVGLKIGSGVISTPAWIYGGAVGSCQYRTSGNRPLIDVLNRENSVAITTTLVHKYAHAFLHSAVNGGRVLETRTRVGSYRVYRWTVLLARDGHLAFSALCRWVKMERNRLLNLWGGN